MFETLVAVTYGIVLFCAQARLLAEMSTETFFDDPDYDPDLENLHSPN